MCLFLTVNNNNKLRVIGSDEPGLWHTQYWAFNYGLECSIPNAKV